MAPWPKDTSGATAKSREERNAECLSQNGYEESSKQIGRLGRLGFDGRGPPGPESGPAQTGPGPSNGFDRRPFPMAPDEWPGCVGPGEAPRHNAREVSQFPGSCRLSARRSEGSNPTTLKKGFRNIETTKKVSKRFQKGFQPVSSHLRHPEKVSKRFPESFQQRFQKVSKSAFRAGTQTGGGFEP